MTTHSSILPGEFQGQRSLVGYSPWGCKRVGHEWGLNKNNIFLYVYVIIENKA